MSSKIECHPTDSAVRLAFWKVPEGVLLVALGALRLFVVFGILKATEHLWQRFSLYKSLDLPGITPFDHEVISWHLMRSIG